MNKNNLAFMPSEPSPPVPERSMQDAFVQDGFALLRGALGSAVRAQAKAHMSEYLSTLLGRKVDYCDGFLAAMAKCPQYLVQEGIGEKLAQAGIYQEILRSPDLDRALLELLGPDLSFSPDQIVAAVAGVEDGYYKKRLHQEIWSGTGINAVFVWAPLALEPGMGGVDFIPGSHNWGLVPHREREPSELPDECQYITPPGGGG